MEVIRQIDQNIFEKNYPPQKKTGLGGLQLQCIFNPIRRDVSKSNANFELYSIYMRQEARLIYEKSESLVLFALILIRLYIALSKNN